MVRRSPLLLAFAVLFGACQGLTEPPVAQFGEPFWLDYGKTVVIPASTGTLHFTQLLEDSRCPSDPLILCVWAGRVRILVTVSGVGSDQAAHELRLLDSPGAIQVGGIVITLLDVAPARTAQEPPPDSEYRAKLRITAMR